MKIFMYNMYEIVYYLDYYFVRLIHSRDEIVPTAVFPLFFEKAFSLLRWALFQ